MVVEVACKAIFFAVVSFDLYELNMIDGPLICTLKL